MENRIKLRNHKELITSALVNAVAIGDSRASIKPGTWNIPEQPGTFRNIPEHGIIITIMRKICEIKFSTTK